MEVLGSGNKLGIRAELRGLKCETLSVEKVQEVEDAAQTATRRDIEALTEEVAQLRRTLDATQIRD